MTDIKLTASLDGVKLLARNVGTKSVRRAQFKLGRGFGLEQAEWLEAVQLREKLQRGELDAFAVPIDAYVARGTFRGLAGNATAEVYGVSAAAKMSGGEDPEPLLTLTFEAGPDVTLLTWLAANVKEIIDVELLRLQRDLLADDKD